MPNREEALRRIFEATGVSGRLTDDQKKELLAHVEDAVEAKVGAGVPEMDAVGQAFEELGDLKKIARDFPPPASGATFTTPDGLIHLWWGGAAEMGYILLLFFAFVEMMILPSFALVFAKARIPLPGLTILSLTIADFMRANWPLVLGALLVLGIALYQMRRPGRQRRVVECILVLSGSILCALVLAAATLPLISLLEGSWRR
ncbi:MAG TPA: permease prefix domain 1-containing protein [Planctomycetota bacterium]|jgi:hypothetical protein|nr:permease prefix domain 1-containing protein [Planctomycetota bacterium]